MTRYVEVRWTDPAGASGWQPQADAAALTPLVCRSVGVILRRDARVLVLASTTSDDGQAADVTAIPAAAVQAIRRLH